MSIEDFFRYPPSQALDVDEDHDKEGSAIERVPIGARTKDVMFIASPKSGITENCEQYHGYLLTNNVISIFFNFCGQNFRLIVDRFLNDQDRLHQAYKTMFFDPKYFKIFEHSTKFGIYDQINRRVKISPQILCNAVCYVIIKDVMEMFFLIFQNLKSFNSNLLEKIIHKYKLFFGHETEQVYMEMSKYEILIFNMLIESLLNSKSKIPIEEFKNFRCDLLGFPYKKLNYDNSF